MTPVSRCVVQCCSVSNKRCECCGERETPVLRAVCTAVGDSLRGGGSALLCQRRAQLKQTKALQKLGLPATPTNYVCRSKLWGGNENICSTFTSKSVKMFFLIEKVSKKPIYNCQHYCAVFGEFPIFSR